MHDLLKMEVRGSLGIANVMAGRKGSLETMAERLGCVLPVGPQACFAGDLTVVGVGPGAWLVLRENTLPDFADNLQETLAGFAAVSDQSSAYVVHRISGPTARGLLRRGAAIDVHPDAFHPGSAATTVIAHIGVILWQVDEQPTYDLAVFRSYSGSFRHWIEQASAAL